MDLRKIEVLDVVGIVRVQDLAWDDSSDVNNSQLAELRDDTINTYLSAGPFGAFHTEDLTRFDGRE
jgi:hypothetical protein